MAFDFPSSPNVGDLYPTSPPAGTAQYRWDGQAWMAVSASAFQPGTVMLFYQPAAPVGWTKLTTQDDKALRVVAGGSGGSAGGTNPFSTVMAQSVVGNHTLAVSEIPPISATSTQTLTVYPGGNSGWFVPASSSSWAQASMATGGGSTPMPYTNTSITYAGAFQGSNTINTQSNNTGGGAHNHPITMNIQYCDVILASKN